LLALGILAVTTAAAAAELRIDAFLEPPDEVYLRQPVRLVVLVETDTWFATAPDYPEIQVPGAIVLQPDTFGVNVSRREGSTTWTGQRQRYLIFPQRTGRLTIPPFRVSVAAADPESSAPPSVQQLTTPPVTTGVVAPPGADEVDAFVATPSYRIAERWEGDPDQLVTGDALVRQVTQTAGDTFALLLPVPQFEAPPGVAVYPAPPILDDRTNRGNYSATRTDSVTYVLERAGTFTLPAISVHWFDLGSGRMRSEVLPGLTLEVEANPSATDTMGALSASEDGMESAAVRRLSAIAASARDNLGTLTLAVAGIWLLFQLWRRTRGPLGRWGQSWRREREFGEPARFSRARRAARQGDEEAFVSAFWAWSDHLPGKRSTLEAPAPAREDTPLWKTFVESRYAGRSATTASGADLEQALIRMRRAWFGQSERRGATVDRLNP
jgi:hypothetical protein